MAIQNQWPKTIAVAILTLASTASGVAIGGGTHNVVYVALNWTYAAN
jgi:hypothetical protein